MTRSIERGVQKYGYMMPLPSDMHEEMKEPVEQLGKLWIHIFMENIHLHDKESMRDLVNEFFDDLPENDRQWLQGEDPVFHKPRSVLVKERAMQFVQIAKTPSSKRRRKMPFEKEVFPSDQDSQPTKNN